MPCISSAAAAVAAANRRRYVYAPFRAGARCIGLSRPTADNAADNSNETRGTTARERGDGSPGDEFGGTSVADIERIRNVARHVKREVDAGHEVAVVVSAMSGTTDRLVDWCREVAALHDAREYDAVVASGEAGHRRTVRHRVSGDRDYRALMAGLAGADPDVWSHASARILDINGDELIKRFKERGEVPGDLRLPGTSQRYRPDHHAGPRRLRYLGGGDRRCYSRRPLRHLYRRRRCLHQRSARGSQARRFDRIAFEEMLELASLGAKVLQVRSVELGMVHRVRIFVRSSFDKPEDIDPSRYSAGHADLRRGGHFGTAGRHRHRVHRRTSAISIRHVQDKPGIAASIFGPLADANINVDMIVQNVSADGATTDLTFTVTAADFERAKETIAYAKEQIGYERLDVATDVTKISVIGVGMRSHAGVAAKAFSALARRDQYPRHHHFGDQVSLLIDAAYTELAVSSLHSLYGLDKP